MDPERPRISGVFNERFCLIKAGHPSLEQAVVSTRAKDEIERLKKKVTVYEEQLGLEPTEVLAEVAAVGLFQQLDRDGDGIINKSEFTKAFTGRRKQSLRAQ